VSTMTTIDADFLAFLAKVKTGAQVLEADFDAVVSAIVANISTINTDMQKVETWIGEILPVAQAAGLSSGDAAVVTSALSDAQSVVTGLDAVAASVNAGNNDVTAIVSGVAAVQQASAATSNLVATVAAMPVPAAAQVVSPPTPNEG